MGGRPTKLLMGNGFVRDRLHHLRTRDVHVGRIPDHENKVGDGRGIHCPASARPHDHRNLRYDSGCQYIALEYFRIARQRINTFLDPCTPGIIKTDHRRPHPHRMIHDFADLPRVRLRERSTKHGEILAKHKHRTTIDRTVPGHHTIAGNRFFGHVEVGTSVLRKHIPFFKTAFIQECANPLASGEFSLGVLRIDTPLASALPCGFAAPF